MTLNIKYQILKPNVIPRLVWLLVLKWVHSIDYKLLLKVNYDIYSKNLVYF